MFSKNLSFLSSRNVSDQVSHPYKTNKQAKLYFSTSLYFWLANRKTNDSVPKDCKHYLSSILSWFLHAWIFGKSELFTNIWTTPQSQMMCCLSYRYINNISVCVNSHFTLHSLMYSVKCFISLCKRKTTNRNDDIRIFLANIRLGIWCYSPSVSQSTTHTFHHQLLARCLYV